MKEFCIEINESQPLEKVEAKLKEMGYKKDFDYTDIGYPAKFISTYYDGTYNVYGYSFHAYIFGDPVLTLDEL